VPQIAGIKICKSMVILLTHYNLKILLIFAIARKYTYAQKLQQGYMIKQPLDGPVDAMP
jgi:hypothetical protein